MAQIILTIPAQHVTRVVNALKMKHPEYGDPGSLLTENQMAKEAVRLWIIRTVKEVERSSMVDNIVLNVPDEIVTGEIQPPPK